jgi:hypothetical protein
VYALTKRDEAEKKKIEPAVETPAKTPAPQPEPQVVVPTVTPDPPPDPTPPDPTTPPAETAGAEDGEIVVDDPAGEDPGKTTKKDPGKTTKKDPGKTTTKKDPGKTESLPEPSLEKLEPFDQKRALSPYSGDVERCRASSAAARGSITLVKIKVEGATGRVLEATPTDTNPAGKCIAKFVKAKVKFPRFKQKSQEFNYRFQM